MSKWSFFFLLIPILGVGIFVAAPFVGWDLPQVESSFGQLADHLYYVILWITGIAFIATQLALFWSLFKFGKGGNQKAIYTHGSTKLEILWTVIPAVILLFLALYQMPAWVQIRYPTSRPKKDAIARVVARQFEWRMVYPGADGKYDTPDDVHIANELHIPMNQDVVIDLVSMDVLHSFFLPHLRIKQDAVPGLRIPVWFDCKKSSRQYQAEAIAFKVDDFTDIGALFLRLKRGPKDGGTKLSQMIFAKLEGDLKMQVSNYDGKTEPTEPLKKAFVDRINEIMMSETFATKDLLEGIRTTDETNQELLRFEQKPKTYSRSLIALLNREILEDAFPSEVKKNRRQFELVCAELCGWGHYKMKGRLVVHETREEFDEWLKAAQAAQEASR